MTPGIEEVGVHAGMHWLVGPRHHMDEALPSNREAVPSLAPADWLRLGCSDVVWDESGRIYEATLRGRRYRFTVLTPIDGPHATWHTEIERLAMLEPEIRVWEQLDSEPIPDHELDARTALLASLRALSAVP